MQPRDLFGVVVRSFGLWFITDGIRTMYIVLLRTAGMNTASSISMAEEKLGTAYWFILGMGLLLLADHIARLVYRPSSK